LTQTTILFYKPFNVLSQFTDEGTGKRTIADFGPFPKSVYPVGRLDYDSEGMLILTDDNALKHRLLDPKFAHTKTYLVQIERIPSEAALERLRAGVVIEGKKTRPARVRLLDDAPLLPERTPPIRVRKTVPDCWIELSITEGRNRQVRKMTAAVGHPTLRLVRTKIGALDLGSLAPGASRLLSDRDVELLLR
jgi:23S rRNA pseudouridine2457 synthase